MSASRFKQKAVAGNLERIELVVHPDDRLELKEFASALLSKRGVKFMSLIEQLRLACQKQRLPKEFTFAEYKEWIRRDNIRKSTGQPYAESAIDALLPNSDIANSGSTNLNKKVLRSFMRNGQKHYTFID